VTADTLPCASSALCPLVDILHRSHAHALSLLLLVSSLRGCATSANLERGTQVLNSSLVPPDLLCLPLTRSLHSSTLAHRLCSPPCTLFSFSSLLLLLSRAWSNVHGFRSRVCPSMDPGSSLLFLLSTLHSRLTLSVRLRWVSLGARSSSVSQTTRVILAGPTVCLAGSCETDSGTHIIRSAHVQTQRALARPIFRNSAGTHLRVWVPREMAVPLISRSRKNLTCLVSVQHTHETRTGSRGSRTVISSVF
jgi:hypothetical protein